MMNDSDYSINNIIEVSAKNKTLHNVMMELNTTCNWRCLHCYIPEYIDKGKELNDIKMVLRQLRALKVYEITFTGGEIFCRNDIMDIIRDARKLGFNVVLFTNMSLLTENMIKELSDLYISLISCTIFSMDPIVHDKITGVKGSLYKTLKNIMCAKEHKLNIEVKCIIMDENFSTYSSVYNFCRENGFLFKPDISIFSKTNGDKSPQKLLLNHEQMLKIMHDVDSIVGYSSLERDSEEYVCPSIRHSISIDVKGNVNPCNRIPLNMGNIYTNNINDIWESSVELDYIRNIKWKHLYECQDCTDKKYCVRCSGVALLEDGGLLAKSNLACLIARVRSEIYKFQ